MHRARIVQATSVSNSTGPKSATANCPGTKTVAGGGGSTTGGGANVGLVQSEPGTPSGSPLRSTSWVATATEFDANGSNWTVTATVICVDP